MEQELPALPEQQNDSEIRHLEQSEAVISMIEVMQEKNGTECIRLSENTLDIPLDHLEPHPLQPRRMLNPTDVKILSESIATRGLGSPLLVVPRQDAPDHYYILDGTRRWNAVKGLKWERISCHIAEVSADEMILGLMLAMDGVREDFDPIERGVAFAKLQEMLKISQRELAKLLGKQQSEISRCANLKQALSNEIIDDYQKSAKPRLSLNHLRELARLKDHPEQQQELYKEALEKNWSTKKLRTVVKNTQAIEPGDFRGNHKFNLETELFDIVIKPKNPQGRQAADVFSCAGAVVDEIFNLLGVHGEEVAAWYDKMALIIRGKLQEEGELIPAQRDEDNRQEEE